MAGTGFSFSSNSSPSFGFSNPSATSSAPSFGFGASTTSSTTSSPSFGFGASTTPSAPSFGFGASAASSAPSAPSFGFGASTTSSAPSFGASSPLFPSSSSTTNLFGSSAGAAPVSNLFGGSGATPTTNLFGSSSGATPTSSLFGSSSSGSGQTPSLFGANSSAAAPSSPSPSPSPFGTSTLFGSPAPGSANLFGSGAPTPSLFGSSSAAPTSSSTTTPLFGQGSTPAASLFGSSTPPASTAATSAALFGSSIASSPGLFGLSPPATTVTTTAPSFGSGSASTTGLFGSSTPPSSTPSPTPGLFGPSSSLFRSSSAAPPFGTSTSSSTAAPTFGSTSSASAAPGFAFPGAASTTSASSAPGFSFPTASTSPTPSFSLSAASSSSTSTTTTSGFSFNKSTTSSVSSSSASSGFSFGNTGLQSSAASTSSVSKPVAFGTTPSSLFSTITTTTTTASAPAATSAFSTASSAGSSGSTSLTGLAFPASIGVGSAASSGFTGFGTLSTPASSSGSTSSFSLSLKSSAVSASSAPQSQSTAALPSLAVASTNASNASTTSAAQISSAIVASSSGTIATITTAVASSPKLPSEITWRTVEEIIKEWNAELQERTSKFRKQANAIAEWDRRILQNHDIPPRLESEVAKVVETQGTLERQLELIETHQDEGYVSLPTSALPQLPPFHYQTVVRIGKVTQRSAWSELAVMKDMLRPEHLAILDSHPQIGNFLRLTGRGKFKASVLHNLMLRICIRMDVRLSKYEYWFLIRGKPIRFGVEEFSLISGLRFGKPSNDDVQTIAEGGNLKNRYFGQWGETKVTVAHLKTKIIAMLNRNANPEDICKLFFVWVLSALLLPTRPSKVVQNYIFAVCDNLEVCERYPWGNKIWKVTVDELMTHICSDHHMTSENNIRRWNAGGFPHIILFWMLEAIEGLPDAANCSRRHDPNVPRYPRMLRWDIGGGNWPNCDDMDKFFGEVQAVIPRLMPDNTELMMAYYRSTKDFFDSVRSNNCILSYRLLTEYFGEVYMVVRDDGINPECLNRPPSPENHAPNVASDAAAPDAPAAPAPMRRQTRSKRLQRNDGASSSQAQPQSSSEPRNEEFPAWAHDIQQRLIAHQTAETQRLMDYHNVEAQRLMDYHNVEVQRLMDYQVQMERILFGQLNTMYDTQLQLQVTVQQLQEMMLKDFQTRGINVNDEVEEDDDEDQV